MQVKKYIDAEGYQWREVVSENYRILGDLLKLNWEKGRKAWINLYLRGDQRIPKSEKSLWMLTVLEGK